MLSIRVVSMYMLFYLVSYNIVKCIKKAKGNKPWIAYGQDSAVIALALCNLVHGAIAFTLSSQFVSNYPEHLCVLPDEEGDDTIELVQTEMCSFYSFAFVLAIVQLLRSKSCGIFVRMFHHSYVLSACLLAWAGVGQWELGTLAASELVHIPITASKFAGTLGKCAVFQPVYLGITIITFVALRIGLTLRVAFMFAADNFCETYYGDLAQKVVLGFLAVHGALNAWWSFNMVALAGSLWGSRGYTKTNKCGSVFLQDGTDTTESEEVETMDDEEKSETTEKDEGVKTNVYVTVIR